MAKVKLIKGLSYSGLVSASRRNPIVEVGEDILQDVLKTGYFALVEGTIPPVPPGKTPEELGAEKAKAEAEAAIELAAFEGRVEAAGLNAPDLTAEQFKAALGKLNRGDVDRFAVRLEIDVQEAKNKEDVITLVMAQKYPTGSGSGAQA